MQLDTNDLRRRVLAGEKLTPELAREVVAALRGERISAATTAASKSRKREVDETTAMQDLDNALGL